MTFKKGDIPWNKGIKGRISLRKGISLEEEYGKERAETIRKKMSERKIGKIPSCPFKKGHPYGKRFKKGNKPWNYIDGRSRLLAPARYGDDWDKIRYLVYLRDRFTCQDCEVTGKRLDIHHIIPFLISFDNSLGNLITLCRKCHMKAENYIRNKSLEVN